MIALTFLVFLSIGIFTLLSSTTSNINKTYNSIAKNGNLHDAVVSEQYSIGSADYQFYMTNDQDPVGEYPTILADETAVSTYYYGKSSDNITIP
jgi:putative ABC transport system permease protein